MNDYAKDFKDNYRLNKIYGKIFKKNIISFDVETHNNNRDFTLASVYDGKEFKMFYGEEGKKEIKKYLIDRKYQSTYICATNLQFDFCAIEGMENLHKYDLIKNGGHFISVKKRTRYKNKNHKGHDTVFSNTFIDSINHYAGSVESAGKIVGLKKMDRPEKLGQNPSKTEKAKAIDDKGRVYEIPEMTEHEYLVAYNKRDSEITYKIMTFLQDAYNELGCEMKLTISSTALDLWKRKYLPCELIKEEYLMNKDIKTEIFKCYYGGRTEIFSRGKIESNKETKWILIDINSLYPYCMTQEFPLPQSISHPKEYTIENIEEYHGFSDVTVECDEMYYPLLPFRHQKLNKLIFPIGTWRASYTHIELRKAIELGYRIKKIHKQHIYLQTFHPYKAFVNDLYPKRQEYKKAGNPMEVVIKLLLNSLYGKQAQKDMSQRLWFNIDEMTPAEYTEYLDSTDVVTLDHIGYKRVVKECNSNFIFPILPAHVTSYGRLRLYKYMTKYKAVYVDTDSCITSSDVKDSKELGEMKVEERLKEATIIKPKMYMKKNEIDEIKVKIKGVPRATHMTFMEILQHHKIFYNKFSKPSESVRRGFEVNTVREESKNVAIDDNKRVWTKPFSEFTIDHDSKPIKINETSLIVRKTVNKKTVREKQSV